MFGFVWCFLVCLFAFYGEVGWGDPKLIGRTSRKAGRVHQLPLCWVVSILHAQRMEELSGMQGGGTAVARGVEELWEQRPCSQGTALLLSPSSSGYPSVPTY